MTSMRTWGLAGVEPFDVPMEARLASLIAATRGEVAWRARRRRGWSCVSSPSIAALSGRQRHAFSSTVKPPHTRPTKTDLKAWGHQNNRITNLPGPDECDGLHHRGLYARGAAPPQTWRARPRAPIKT